MTVLEKEDLKKTLKEVFQEDKNFFKELFIEVIREESYAIEADKERDERIKAIIKNDFKRYKNVFKTLA